MRNDDTIGAAVAHGAYLAQTRQLVDTHTEALFGLLTSVLARAASHEPAARHIEASRHDHTLAVANRACAEEFRVAVISQGFAHCAQLHIKNETSRGAP